ncbi:hypothetical protein MFM001_23910 [Mycobacterium sp. MFM001]|uniref:hypothetical protein n=1 Tax=Mycobacterium sp. MFM001 TaxID=2049453 RepID=UPI000DA5573B|nr:hypothetical protein [Mycobacterium sp. MFM001]GBE65929.1 hypothetical protein MFM001_23910 [Mycobacterium sp. MFM001]
MTDSRIGRGALHMPRSRGAVSGLLLIILGAWGALIPFVGPYFHWAYTPDKEWTWTAARGWLEVFPGVAAVVGGLLLVGSGNRATAMFGGWLAAFAGAWFVVGRPFASPLRLGDVGQPVASNDTKRALLEITYFSGLGALIVFLAGAILARLAVRTARDVEAAAAVAPADVPPADVPPAPEYTPAPEASPDAVTQARAEPFPAEKREEGRSLFRRRKRADASR